MTRSPTGATTRPLKDAVWLALPETAPGIKFDDIQDRLYLSGKSVSQKTLRVIMTLLRADNMLREDGRHPQRYWRGPGMPQRMEAITGRPAWTVPDARLVAECREGRREIREAMRR